MNDELIQIGGKTYRYTDVVMLPTEKVVEGYNIFSTGSNELRYQLVSEDAHIKEFSPTFKSWIPQHLYILSNEDIKEGDWCMNMFGDKRSIFKITQVLTDGYEGQRIGEKYIVTGLGKTLKKIIATTNSDIGEENVLGKDFPLPRPSNDFIQAFIREWNKGNKIEKVLVEYEITNLRKKGAPLRIQDAKYGLKIAPDNTITIKNKDIVPLGKTMFTREEVIEKFLQLGEELQEQTKVFAPAYRIGRKDIKQWIKQNL